MRETELKLRVTDLAPIRARLEHVGARLKEVVEDERDLFFRPSDGSNRLAGEVLRLRRTPTGGTLTWKGRPSFERGVKSRDEVQTTVGDPNAMAEILSRLGYEAALSFTKRREYWDLGGLTVSLDTLPFGTFVEIEGDEERIEDAVRGVGLERAECVQQSYPEMAAEFYGVRSS